MNGSDRIAVEDFFEAPRPEGPAFGAEERRAVFLAATFLKHVHEHHEAGMRSVLEVVNSNGLVSEFVAGMAAVAVGLGRRVYREEELGQALQDYAIRINRESIAVKEQHP